MIVFSAGADGYHTFRIPALVRSAAGVLLAFAEGRRGSASDTGHIDLVLKRSTDGGQSWGPLQVAAAEPGGGTAGNAAPVVLATGRILLVFVRNAASATEARIRRGQVSAADGRRVFVQHSDDDGATWSAPREITAQAKDPSWRWYATTPGHAIQLSTGRIVVPANHSTPQGPEGKYDGGHCLLSDDLGANWRIGYLDDNPDGYVNVNETTAAELPDGRVYFNTRTDSTAPGNRADAYSSDGGQSLEEPFRPQADLVTPVVEGSLLQWRSPDVLLFSAPADPGARAVMTLRASTDDGLTWKPVRTLSGLPAAYSDLVRLDDDALGLLYETGDFGPYERITFERLIVRDLLS